MWQVGGEEEHQNPGGGPVDIVLVVLGFVMLVLLLFGPVDH